MDNVLELARGSTAVPSTGTKLLGLALVSLLCSFGVFLMHLYLTHSQWSMKTLTIVSVFIVGLAVIIFSLRTGSALLGLTGVYLFYLVLTHLGVPFSVLLSRDPFRNFRDHQIDWFYSPSANTAVILSALGILSFTVTAALTSFILRRSPNAVRKELQGDRGVYVVGLSLLVVSALYLLVAIALGVLPISGTYREYRAAIAQLPGYAWFVFAVATGITFSLASGGPRQRSWAWAVFFVISLILLMTGNRGEVFYPALAGIGVMSVRGLRLNWRIIVLGVLVFFFLIPVIQQTRHLPVSEISLRDLDISPLDPILEIGFTLRPVVVTMEWIREGEDYAYGQTYLLPVLRIVGLVIPFYERPEILGTRFAVNERTPRMGYSVIAEAYFNFGALGVVAVLGLIGFILARFGDRARTPRQLAFSAALGATLINNIRNSFIFVPGQVAAVCGLLFIAIVIGRIRWRTSEAFSIRGDRRNNDNYSPVSVPESLRQGE